MAISCTGIRDKMISPGWARLQRRLKTALRMKDVPRLRPDSGQSMRGVMIWVDRVAFRENLKIEWRTLAPLRLGSPTCAISLARGLFGTCR